jgi:hypothetical protein
VLHWDRKSPISGSENKAMGFEISAPRSSVSAS